MSSADQFIKWYANRINESDLVEVRNKLFSIRTKNLGMYNFLVSEFQNDTRKIPDNTYRVTSIQTRMISESSIPDEQKIVCTTNMASFRNIPKKNQYMLSAMDYKCNTPNNSHTFMDDEVNIPITKMASSSNIPKDASRLRFLKGENLNYK